MWIEFNGQLTNLKYALRLYVGGRDSQRADVFAIFPWDGSTNCFSEPETPEQTEYSIYQGTFDECKSYLGKLEKALGVVSID